MRNIDRGKKRGLKDIFAITQIFTQVFDLAEIGIKGVASNASMNTILSVLQPC